MKEYFVYILTNSTKSILYIGVTNDLRRRVSEHNNNESSFTSRYAVRHLLYYERFGNIDEAMAREKQLKGWRRDKKEWLISTKNPSHVFLTMDEQE